jgi:hypothetical protein
MGNYGCNMDFFFFDLKIEIYITHTHTLFGEGRGDLNLCQMGGRNSLAPLGQMPSGRNMDLKVKTAIYFYFIFFPEKYC